MNPLRPNRHSIRLPDWDYRTAGYYFVTICTHRREHTFDDPRLHEIAAKAWVYIPQQPKSQHVTLNEWVVMPNHLHGLIEIVTDPELNSAPKGSDDKLLPGSIGAIVGNYKMLVTKRIKAICQATGTDMKVWQRGYWDRIVRNERELNAIRQYIWDNPLRWAEDRDNLDQVLARMRYVDGI